MKEGRVRMREAGRKKDVKEAEKCQRQKRVCVCIQGRTFPLVF